MPTGRAETAADRLFGGLIKDNQQADLQFSRRQKRSRFAGPLQMTGGYGATKIGMTAFFAGH